MGDRQLRSRRLTVAAQGDVDEIWFYTARAWSNEQADRYIAALYDVFDLLLQHPHLARERDDAVPPIRLHPHRSQLIAYRFVEDELIIVRVLHMRQDWRALLSAESDQS